MTKLKHYYTKELGSLFMRMTDDEYIEWLKTNEVEYQKPLLKIVQEEPIQGDENDNDITS